MSYTGIPGWSVDIEPFYKSCALGLPIGARFLEVGVFLGRSLACMAELRDDIELWGLDPFSTDESWGGPDTYRPHIDKYGGSQWAAFLQIMAKNAPNALNRARILRAKSCDIDFREGFDMIFIDAAHDYLNVTKDIAWARRHVKPNGILSGHDYCETFPGVIQAVNEAFPFATIQGTCWKVTRP